MFSARMRLLRGVSVSGIGRSILFELLLFSLKQMVLDPIQPAQEEQVALTPSILNGFAGCAAARVPL